MKNNIFILVAMALLTFSSPTKTNAAIQVYDLKADWSDTHNPNGTWSYCWADGSLLPNDVFSWGVLYGGDLAESIRRTTASSALPGFLEVGDIAVTTYAPITVRWTSPTNGTINVYGTIWNAIAGSQGAWTLSRNGGLLSDGQWNGSPRSAPYDLILGSAGANGLLNIQVQAGDNVDLTFVDFQLYGPGPIGINFTVTLTSDSGDPVTAVKNLATAVIQMNLQNGISNSLDAKLDAALNVLTDVNIYNDAAACNSLNAFISAVEAQRGKKISNPQADQLVSTAQAIRAQLHCGS